MPITFDPVNKYILLPNPAPTYKFTAQEIYNAAMDWHAEQASMDDDPPMRSTGYASLGGGAYTDKIFILQKGWKLKPYSGTYTLTIVGTLIALDDEGNPYDRTVPPDSGTVVWVFQVTSQGIISVQGSGVTDEDKEDIANLVETKTGQPLKEDTSQIKLHHTGRTKLEGDYLCIYNENNQLVAKYRIVKDAEGRIIERIPI